MHPLPLFPLNIVVFPDEKLNLHIFEPRYKQLINDIKANGGTFGIPAYINETLGEYGTQMELLEITNTYPDGTMDIKTKGKSVFRIEKYEEKQADKLYPGGLVQLLEQDPTEDKRLRLKLIDYLDHFFELLHEKPDKDEYLAKRYLSYEIGHKVAFRIEEEYTLLKTLREQERQKYVVEHLDKLIPVLVELEKTKNRIRMNGHFKPLT